MNRSRPAELLVPAAALAVILVITLVAARPRADPVPSNPASASATTTTSMPSTTTSTSTSIGVPEPDPDEPVTVMVAPGDDLATLVATSAEGSTFVFGPGIYRGVTITPRAGQQFLGTPGTVLSGAQVLTTFRAEDSVWVADNQSTEGRVHGLCSDGFGRCNRPEAVFVDDRLLRHVEQREDVGPDSWFFDYTNDQVVLGEDPTGAMVELSVLPVAFTGDVNDVTIDGLTIEKYATPAQEGAVDSRRGTADLVGGRRWTITNNIVRWNHGIGISATTDALVEGNTVYQNGQMGLSAHGADIEISANEVYENNTAGFSRSWEAGGGKFTFTQRLVVRDNFVHDNAGAGLWTDIDNLDTRYEGNKVIDNERIGIFHEISYDAVIIGNEVRGNGFGFDAWLWGAGIAVAGSPNVEIVGNIVIGNADGIVAIQQDRTDAPASYGPVEVENLSVHDNQIRGNVGWTGLGQDVGDDSFFTSRNNRFFDNDYGEDDDPSSFYWLNGERTRTEWTSFGLS